MKKRRRERRRNHVRCRFCDWIEDSHFEEEKSEGYRLIEKTNDYIAILDKHPKIVGHVLLISTKQLDDVTQLDPESEHATKLFQGLVKTCRLLKDRLTGKDGKVYVMTMCEHWKSTEIGSKDKKTTEHLHFHLLPRYSEMRTKELAMERLFIRPEDTGWTPNMLKDVRNRLAVKVFLDTNALIALAGLPRTSLLTDFVTNCRRAGIVLSVSHIQVDEKVDREMPSYQARIDKAILEVRNLGLETVLEPTAVGVWDVSRWDLSRWSGEVESALYRKLVELISICDQKTGKKGDATRDAIIGVSALDHDLFVVCDECLFRSFQSATASPENLRNRLPKTILRKPTAEDVATGILEFIVSKNSSGT